MVSEAYWLMTCIAQEGILYMYTEDQRICCISQHENLSDASPSWYRFDQSMYIFHNAVCNWNLCQRTFKGMPFAAVVSFCRNDKSGSNTSRPSETLLDLSRRSLHKSYFSSPTSSPIVKSLVPFRIAWDFVLFVGTHMLILLIDPAISLMGLYSSSLLSGLPCHILDSPVHKFWERFSIFIFHEWVQRCVCLGSILRRRHPSWFPTIAT